METLNVKSSELREGDVVLCHGMRVLLDGPIQSRSYPEQYGCTETFWMRGLVLNVDELSDPWLVGMTREYQPWPNRHVPTGEHRWTIQGNDNARWLVERA